MTQIAPITMGTTVTFTFQAHSISSKNPWYFSSLFLLPDVRSCGIHLSSSILLNIVKHSLKSKMEQPKIKNMGFYCSQIKQRRHQLFLEELVTAAVTNLSSGGFTLTYSPGISRCASGKSAPLL